VYNAQVRLVNVYNILITCLYRYIMPWGHDFRGTSIHDATNVSLKTRPTRHNDFIKSV